MSNTYAVHGTDTLISKIGHIELESEQRTDANGYLTTDGSNASIALAHGTDATPYIILKTNGDDQVIAWIDEDGTVEVMDDAAEKGADPQDEDGWFYHFASRAAAGSDSSVKSWIEHLLCESKITGLYGN